MHITDADLFKNEIDRLKKNKKNFQDKFEVNQNSSFFSENRPVISFSTELFDFKKLHSSDYIKHKIEYLPKNSASKFLKGKLLIEDKIDLHHFTVSQSADYLADFISESLTRQYKIIQVITGKNTRSDSNYPVIKTYVYNWLVDCPYVIAFSSANPENGGTGSYFLYLKNIYKKYE